METQLDLYDVVIVGYGPVGATLANLLVQQGLSVAILERESGVYHLARAGHFDAEVMRVFQSIGVADEVEAQSGITLGMRWLDADGALLMEWRRGGDKGPFGWVSDYMFHQPDLERTLRAKLSSSTRAKSFLLHDVYDIDEQPGHVVVRAEDMAHARLVEIRGRYVVGCDGARSLVRRCIGSEHEDLGFKQRWLVVDVLESRDLGLERVSMQHCNPERPMYASSTANGRLRWEIMVKPEDDMTQIVREKSVWDFIENSVRPISREDGEITRSVVYTFESLIAKRWRNGRLLIAGDSAHRTPPFLGQGMCAGIRDAANLAWKLAAVCQGRAQETLLDTYEPERIPHVRAFIQGAAKAVATVAAEGSLGRQVVQPRIDGRLMDDKIGQSFAVISTKAFAHGHAEVYQRVQSLTQLKWVVLPDEHAGLLESYEAPAIFVRPDRYVHAAIADGSELQAIIDELPLRLV